MRREFDDIIADLEGDELLTTGEAAKLIGVSRQHVVDLIDRGELPAIRVGTHRRVRRGDVMAVRGGSIRATRDQDRSLWLSIAIAGEFVRRPDEVRESGRSGLASGRIRPNRWTEEWAVLLDGPPMGILQALTADTARARELRQNSPFTKVLASEDREWILRAFRTERAR